MGHRGDSSCRAKTAFLFWIRQKFDVMQNGYGERMWPSRRERDHRLRSPCIVYIAYRPRTMHAGIMSLSRRRLCQLRSFARRPSVRTALYMWTCLVMWLARRGSHVAGGQFDDDVRALCDDLSTTTINSSCSSRLSSSSSHTRWYLFQRPRINLSLWWERGIIVR